MAETSTIKINLGKMPADKADRYAVELQKWIKSDVPDVKVDRERNASDTMDGGATLVLLLGTPAIIHIAKAVANWISTRPNLVIEIDNGKGKTTKVTAHSEHAEEVVRAAMGH